jgi:hypothetical protein
MFFGCFTSGWRELWSSLFVVNIGYDEERSSEDAMGCGGVGHSALFCISISLKIRASSEAKTHYSKL